MKLLEKEIKKNPINKKRNLIGQKERQKERKIKKENLI